MADSRAGSACSLVEVAWILVQQRRQGGTADHDVRKTVRGHRAYAFAIRAPTLSILGTVPGLLGAGNKKDSRGSYRIDRDFECELKFHFRCEWRCITIV